MYNDFDAGKKFWSDSNSLAMIPRKIVDLGHYGDTIAGNYYPITSAIAMRNEKSKLQVTVMNDRTQGGSADLMDNNAIELMQHRMSQDQDEKGNAEPLNETSSDDIGIRVNARYYMQIFDTQKGQSLQRFQQINTDNPLSYFFLFDFEQKPVATKGALSQYQYASSLMNLDTFADKKSESSAMKKEVDLVKEDDRWSNNIKVINLNTSASYAQFTEQGNIRIMPVAKNQILVRLENLGDRFDAKTHQISYINLEKLANLTYFEVNKANASSIYIEEQSIQGSQL